MAQITGKAGNYGYRVYYRDSNGKRHSINKKGFKRKSDAVAAAAEIENKKYNYGISDLETATFGDYFEQWSNTYKIGRFSTSTDEKYKYATKLIKEKFGNTPLKKVTKLQYQQFLDNYGSTHTKDSTSRINGYIRASLQDALDEKIITRDFTRNAVLSGGANKDPDLKFLETEEASQLKKLSYEHASVYDISSAIIVFAISTGARFAEIVGMTYDCIDFENRTITINKTYDYKTRSGFGPTKNKQSMRTIPVDAELIKFLKKLQLQQRSLFLKQGFKNKHNFVFINNRYNIPSDNAANKVLINYERKLKTKNKITMHGLRHTHASILIAKGISLDYVSERLGHSSTAITIKTYVHLLQDTRKENEDRTVRLMNDL